MKAIAELPKVKLTSDKLPLCSSPSPLSSRGLQVFGDFSFERSLQHLPGSLPRQSFQQIGVGFSGRKSEF
ncbi:MAG: hypothetical protein AB7P14_19405 [Blastocatellales bacterium]